MPLVFAAATVAVTPDPVEAQTPGSTLPTDSLTGSLAYLVPEGFVVSTDDGREVLLEIAADTVDTRGELVADSVTREVPHASVMDRRDIMFVLRQLEESDERDRLHVHYVTVGEAEPRRVAIWLSAARARVPGS